MNNNYRQIYEDLYLNYFDTNEIRMDIRREIASKIDNAINSLDLIEKIRSDAKLFLLVNLTELIYLPLIVNSDTEQTRETLNQYIEEDIKSILVAAMQVSSLRNQTIGIAPEPISDNRQISSHDTLIAVQSIWSLLKTLKIEVWGD